jgi:replication factor A3
VCALRRRSDYGVVQSEDIESTYFEVVGRVIDPTTVHMLACVNLGSDLGMPPPVSSVFNLISTFSLDMKLVNDTIELIHDPRFYSKMFC